MKIDVYLSFAGQCEEALKLYQQTLGGEITMIMRYKDAPEDACTPDTDPESVMHASLQTAGMTIMGNDTPPGFFIKPQGYNLSISVSDEAEAQRIFKALSEGGTVSMPLEKTFWARAFGMLTDRFGINWMVNCE